MVHGHALYHMQHRPLEARAFDEIIANEDPSLVERDNPFVVVYKTLSADFEGAIGGYMTEVLGPNGKPTALAMSTTTKNTNIGVGPAVGVTKTTPETTKATAATTTKENKSSATTTETTRVDPTRVDPTTTIENTAAITTSSDTTQSPSSFITSASSTTADSSQDVNSLAATSSPTSTNSAASSSPTATSVSPGMSGGAKAGIAIGVILGIGVIAALVFFLIRKKKRNQEPEEIQHEKEGFPLPPPPPPMKPSTPSTPPQLSVRPVTQFAPDLSSNGGFKLATAVAAGGLGAGAVGAAVASRNLTGNSPPPTPPMSSSSNQNPFSDPVNPFSPEQASPSASGAGPSEAAFAATAAGAAVAAGVASHESNKEQSSRPGSQESGVAMPANTSPNRVSADGESVSSEVMALAGGAAVGAAVGGAAAAAAAGGAPGPNNVHRVQMDFNPSAEDELELRSGALVRMLHEYDDGWVSA